MSAYRAIHKPDEHRFEVQEEGGVAYVEYYIHNGYLDIIHTIVPMHLENRGIGSAMVRAAYDWAHSENLKPKGSCAFANAWLRRHPEYK